TVIPYGVGVDIACRMKLTVLDVPPETLDEQPGRLEQALLRETQFGTGAVLRKREDHAVLDGANWSGLQVLRERREKAAGRRGTSGSGSRLVEFGLRELDRPDLGLDAGRYLAVLSHSGSRGSGARVASHYTKVARDLHPELPKELSYLAWLDLDSEPGQ